MFVGDFIIRKSDRVINKGGDVVVYFPGAKKRISWRGWKKPGSGQGRFYFCTHRD